LTKLGESASHAVSSPEVEIPFGRSHIRERSASPNVFTLVIAST
jgi:hypothetical protein